MRSRLLFSSLFAAMTLVPVTTVIAAELTVSIELPVLEVAEYHEPYVALWIENEKGESTNLAVWYQLEERGQKSDKGE